LIPAPDGRPVLVTGGAGFIGCNIADRLASAGHPVIVLDALVRGGVEANLAWLERRHGDRVRAIVGDVRDGAVVEAATREARAVFHMAAQVAVTTSFTDPRDDFDVNVVGTLNLLDALRRRGAAVPLVFASTNKVYGDLGDLEFALVDESYRPVDQGIAELGIGEDRALDFHTPYGCSKGAADQYVLDYSRSFGVPTAVLRMSCIYGERQMGTEDQGWVAHFLIRALEGRPITIYGDGFQVRDVLDVSDAVDAYVAAWANIDRVAGRAFNLGGGPRNAISLRALVAYAGELLHRNVEIAFEGWRAGDQKYFVADTRAVQAELGVGPSVPWRRGVARLARWLAESREMDGTVARIDAIVADAAA
jgi:CDP-paratose 2-epimerase